MRARPTLAAWIWLLLAAILIGASLGLAARAHADIDPVAAEYGTEHAAAICATLDAYPTVAGVMGIGQAIVKDGFLSFYQAGQAIGVAVYTVCPEHEPVIDRFIAAYTGGVTRA